MLFCPSDDCELSLTLSKDNKSAASGQRQPCKDGPERFEMYQQVLCNEGLSGRRYWEVEWSGYVRAGVSYRGIRRKTWDDEASLGHSERSWVFDYYPVSGYCHIHKGKKARVFVSMILCLAC